MGEEERRCFLVHVFDQLHKDDVEKLAYFYSLSPRNYKGFATVHMELLDYLTDLGTFNGGDIERFIHYLLSIGRVDVCQMIQERIIQDKVFRRDSLGFEQQRFHQKKQSIIYKVKAANESIKTLELVARTDLGRTGRFYKAAETFLTNIIQSARLSQITPSSFIYLSQFWDTWPTTFSQFQQESSSITLLGDAMGTCHHCYQQFSETLPESWEVTVREAVMKENNITHPLEKYAREAHEQLLTLSAEFIGGNQLETLQLESSDKATTECIYAVESLHYSLQYITLICKWLKTIIRDNIKVVDSETITIYIKQHWRHVEKNEHHLIEIFGQDTIDNVKQQLGLRPVGEDEYCDVGDMTTYTVALAFCALVWHTALIALLPTVQVSPAHIEAQLRIHLTSEKQLKELMRVYISVSQRVATEIERQIKAYKERFQEAIISMAGYSPDLRDLIIAVFSEGQTTNT